MSGKPLLNELIDSLRCLPGVGPKSAQRMAFHILQRDRAGGARLAAVLAEAVQSIGHCRLCRTLTEDEVCELCRNPARDDQLLCVVENPASARVLEKSGFQRETLLANYFPCPNLAGAKYDVWRYVRYRYPSV